MARVADGPPETGSVDLGDGHWYIRVVYNDTWVGINEWHKDGDGRWCGGWVPFTGSEIDTGDGWTVDQREPLTLSPSLQCLACPSHGFIRQGRWVPA